VTFFAFGVDGIENYDIVDEKGEEAFGRSRSSQPDARVIYGGTIERSSRDGLFLGEYG